MSAWRDNPDLSKPVTEPTHGGEQAMPLYGKPTERREEEEHSVADPKTAVLGRFTWLGYCVVTTAIVFVLILIGLSGPTWAFSIAAAGALIVFLVLLFRNPALFYRQMLGLAFGFWLSSLVATNWSGFLRINHPWVQLFVERPGIPWALNIVGPLLCLYFAWLDARLARVPLPFTGGRWRCATTQGQAVERRVPNRGPSTVAVDPNLAFFTKTEGIASRDRVEADLREIKYRHSKQVNLTLRVGMVCGALIVALLVGALIALHAGAWIHHGTVAEVAEDCPIVRRQTCEQVVDQHPRQLGTVSPQSGCSCDVAWRVEHAMGRLEDARRRVRERATQTAQYAAVYIYAIRLRPGSLAVVSQEHRVDPGNPNLVFIDPYGDGNCPLIDIRTQAFSGREPVVVELWANMDCRGSPFARIVLDPSGGRFQATWRGLLPDRVFVFTPSTANLCCDICISYARA